MRATTTVTMTVTATATESSSTQTTTAVVIPPVTPPPPLPAKLKVTPLKLDFSQPSDGYVPPPKIAQIRNGGDLPLAIPPPATNGRSFRLSNDCPPQLAKGESCGVAVVFDASVAGSPSGTVTVGGANE